MTDPRLAKIRRMNWAFQIILGVALTCLVIELWHELFGMEFRPVFRTAKGLQTLTAKDVTAWQRMVVLTIAAMPDLCWCYGLIQLALMSVPFRHGTVFSEAVIRRFHGFAFALVLNSIAEALCVPAIVGYLVWLGKIDPLESVWRYLPSGGTLATLLSALLVSIVARIMQIAIQMHEETQLTI